MTRAVEKWARCLVDLVIDAAEELPAEKFDLWLDYACAAIAGTVTDRWDSHVDRPEGW